MIGRIDGLAHVVQAGPPAGTPRRRAARLARQLEDLQAVIERVPLGMISGTLLDGLERLEQEPVELEAVDVVLEPFDLLLQVDRRDPPRKSRSSSSAIEARSIALPVIELLNT